MCFKKITTSLENFHPQRSIFLNAGEGGPAPTLAEAISRAAKREGKGQSNVPQDTHRHIPTPRQPGQNDKMQAPRIDNKMSEGAWDQMVADDLEGVVAEAQQPQRTGNRIGRMTSSLRHKMRSTLGRIPVLGSVMGFAVNSTKKMVRTALRPAKYVMRKFRR